MRGRGNRLTSAATAMLLALMTGAACDTYADKPAPVKAIQKAVKRKAIASDTVSPSPIADDSPIDPTTNITAGGKNTKSARKSRDTTRRTVRQSTDTSTGDSAD